MNIEEFQLVNFLYGCWFMGSVYSALEIIGGNLQHRYLFKEEE